MRVFLVSILFFLSPYIQACEDEHKTEHTPFANIKGNSANLVSYEIFAPKKAGEYFLTSIYLYKKDELYISLDFHPAFRYPEYQQTSIDVSAKLVDEYEIYFNYSTTKDGGLVMCGGNVVKTSIKELLSEKKAKEAISPPPLASV